MAMDFCPKCGMGISKAAPICPHCGVTFKNPAPPRKRPPHQKRDGTLTCPECGIDGLPPQAFACYGCGYPLRASEPGRRRKGCGCGTFVLAVVVAALVWSAWKMLHGQ